MKRYDYSFLKGLMCSQSLMTRHSRIFELRAFADMGRKNDPEVFESLESLAKYQSVKFSNRIEGIITTDVRLRGIMERSVAPAGHDEGEIAGYRDALDLIHRNHSSLRFTEDTILRLYGIMMPDIPSPGYKRFDNAIFETLSDGTRRLHFMTVSADETPKSMEQLVFAYSAARSDSEIDPLLLIPCVILDFLCIHPFQDGNGRMSRLLTLLLLYNEGFDIGKYVSLEAKIHSRVNDYYNALERSSEGWHDGSNDYVPFIEEFIGELFLCYRDLDMRMKIVDSSSNKSDRVRRAVADSLLPVSKKEIVELFPDISVTTVEKVLSDMLKEGSIEKIGSTRGARYRRKRLLRTIAYWGLNGWVDTTAALYRFVQGISASPQ